MRVWYMGNEGYRVVRDACSALALKAVISLVRAAWPDAYIARSMRIPRKKRIYRPVKHVCVKARL